MAFYITYTALRATPADDGMLQTRLRAIEPTLGFWRRPNSSVYQVKCSNDLLQAQVTAIQQAIENAPAQTDQTFAQDEIDGWPIELKALVLALIDQLNVIRAALPVPLGAITPAQALAAIRAKAGTL